MTAIPGTAMPTNTQVSPTPSAASPATPLKTAEPAPATLQVTNVEEIKKTAEVPTVAKVGTVPVVDIWYNRLYSWMGFGAIVGILLALIGFKYPSFFTLAPLGPTIGALAWYIRKFVTKYGKSVDAFSGK